MPGSQPIQSVSRAVELLRMIARAPAALTVRHLAEQTGLKRTTVANLMRTLAEECMVSSEGSPAVYSLGPTVQELASSLSTGALHAAAGQAMCAAQRTVPVAGFVLSEIVGGHVYTSLRVDDTRPGVIQQPTNAHRHPYATATGLIALAFSDEESRHHIDMNYEFNEYGGHLWQRMEKLEAFLHQARTDGWLSCTVHRHGYTSIGVPIYDAGHNFIAAMGGWYRFTANQKQHDAMLGALRLAVEQIHAALVPESG